VSRGSKAGEWLEVRSDGASRGNPGPAGAGGLARDPRGRVLAKVSDYLGVTTSNVAEYHALIRILEESGALGFENVRISLDSKLVVNQVRGGFKVKSEALVPLFARVKTLLSSYRGVEVVHVPREKNTECDALANRAIDDGLAGRKQPIIEVEKESLF
jgi:ribonuclease HI